jgi:hypothetical protein
MMRSILLILALFSFVATNAVADEAGVVIPQEKNVIKFPAKIGDVTFAHQMHASLTITECKTCHHKYEPTDSVMKPCHECHKHKGKKIKDVKDGEAPKTKDAFHVRCIGCHEYTVAGGGQAGPVKKKCKLCHVKPKKK